MKKLPRQAGHQADRGQRQDHQAKAKTTDRRQAKKSPAKKASAKATGTAAKKTDKSAAKTVSS